MESIVLKQKRNSAVAQINALNELLKKEARTFSQDEETQFDRMMAEVRSFDKQIQLAEFQESEERAKHTADAMAKKANPSAPDKAEIRAKFNHAFKRYLEMGVGELSTEERAIIKGSGMNIESRALSTTTATSGAEFIREEYIDEFEKFLVADGGVLGACRVIRTNTGADFPYPTVNDTSVSAVIVAENSSAGTATDPTTGNVVFKSFIYSSQPILVPYSFFDDEGWNLTGMIPELMAERIARGFNAHATKTGNGTTAPEAIVTGAGNSSVTITAGTITREKLIDLKHSVIEKYRRNAVWMFNDSTLASLAKLSLGSADDTPLWTPSMREGEPDRLLGKPYVINDYMDTLATSTNRPVLFGDMSKYIVRIVKDTQIMRANELYMANYQVGFFGFSRMDGRIVNSDAIKYLAVT